MRYRPFHILNLERNHLKEAGNALQATGQRKNGKGDMQENGKSYVTKSEKLCLELVAGRVDENWCRDVFRIGNGCYVPKDASPARLAHRFTLDKG